MSLPLGLELLQLAADLTELAFVWLIQSSVVLAIGLLAGWLLSGRGPALRSAIYRTTLTAVAVCPLASMLTSSWGRLPLPAFHLFAEEEKTVAVQDDLTSQRKPTESDLANERTARSAAQEHPEGFQQRNSNDPFVASPPLEENLSYPTQADSRLSGSAATQVSLAAPPAPTRQPKIRTALAAFVVSVALSWLAISSLLLGRLLVGLSRMSQLCRRAVPVDAGEQRLCNELAVRFGIAAPPVLRTPFTSSPCLAGLRRPVILLSEEPLAMPLEAVLVHELAHLRRGDHLWNFGSRIVLAVFFFQPLLWRLVRQLQVAAEEVCDDHVIHFGADRTRYANGLVMLAEQSAIPLPNVSVPLFTLRSLLARRVRRILDYQGSRFLRIGKPAICTLFIIGVLTAAMSGLITTPDSAGAVSANQESRGSSNPQQPTASSTDQSDPLPPGVMARLGTTRYRPSRAAKGIGFLPDGKTIVLTTTEGLLEHWDAKSGRFLREIRVTKEEIREADHTADGRWIAIRGLRRDEQKRDTFHWVAVVDAQTGQERMRRDVEGNRRGELLAISDNGATVATDDALAIFGVSSGTELLRWPLKETISSMAFSPNGETLAVGMDGMARVWDWTTGVEPRRFTRRDTDPRHRPSFNPLAFSPDGSLMAAGDDNGLSLFDVAQGTEIKRLTIDGAASWGPRHIVFSPDTRVVAAAIRYDRGDAAVAIWDIKSGKSQNVLAVPHDQLRHLAFSPDGRLLAGTSWTDPVLCVWNVTTGDRLGSDLIGHEHAPNTLRFLPGDDRLVSAGDDATVRIWNIATSQQERLIELKRDPNGQAPWIRAMDVSADAKYIASSSFDDVVRVWETATARELYRLPGHSGSYLALRFTPDSQRLVSWGGDMRVVVWDVKTGRALQEYRPQPSGMKLPPEDQANDSFRDRFQFGKGVFSPDASLLFIQAPENRVFDVATGKELVKFAGPQGFNRDPAISPDNQYVLSTTTTRGRQIPAADGLNQLVLEWNNTIELRKLADGQLVATKTLPNGWGRSAVAIAPDGRRAAIAIDDDKPYVLFLDIPDLREAGRINDLAGRPSRIEFSRSGKRLAISNYDGTVSVFDVEQLAQRGEKQSTAAPTRSKSSATTPNPDNDQERTTLDTDTVLPPGAIARLGTTRFRPGQGTQAVSFLPDKRTLVVSQSEGRLQYWDAQSGRFLRDVVFAKPHVSAAAHTVDGRFVAARGWYREGNSQESDYWVALVDAQSGKELVRHDVKDRHGGRNIAVAENGSVIAVDGDNVTLIDVTKGEAIEWTLDKLPPTSLALSSDGNLLAVGSTGLVRVWKWRESPEPRYFAIARKDPRTQAYVNSIAFSPDGALLAVGDHVEGVSLIDLRTGKQIHQLSLPDMDDWRGHSLTFSPDGKLLATPIIQYCGGGVAIWNVETGRLTRRLEMTYDGVRNVTFSPDGRFLAGIPWEGMLCVWNVGTGELAGRDRVGHQTPPNTIGFFPGDERLASAGDDSTAHIWNLTSGKAERVIRHEPDPKGYVRMLRAMDVSPDGKYIATSCLDNTVRLWDSETGREVFKLPGHGRLGGTRSVRFTPDSLRLVSWGDDMHVYTWDVRTGKAINEYRAQPAGEKLPDESDIGEPWFGRNGPVFSLDGGTLSPDASRLLAIGRRSYIFDVATGRETAAFDREQGSFITALAISPDNEYVLMLVGGQGKEITLPDGKTTRERIHRAELRKLSDGQLVAQMDQGENPWPAAVAISHDSRRAAITTGAKVPYVAIIEIPEMTEIKRIEGFLAAPRALEFSRSGKLLAVSKQDTTVVVYDLEMLPGKK